MPSDPQQDQAIHHERPMQIICIGAGASGLCFAYKLQRSFRNFSLTIYEKNAEVSGTWYENNYPGCTCDIPAHNYTYSFEPKHDWTSVYASSKEIREYFNSFCKKYGLHKYIKFSHKVIGAQWRDAKGKWDISVEDLASDGVVGDSCHILINASGYLNKWAWPDVPGLQEYRGRLVHSANWDDSINLEGKRVGLIGNGSSGVQILPKIQSVAEHLTVFIRSPVWLLPTVAGGQHVYTPKEIEHFATNRDALTTVRKNNEANLNSYFSVYLEDSILQSEATAQFTEEMRKKLQDNGLDEKLVPPWGIGCRRLVPNVGYLERLGEGNVQVVYGGVIALTEHGCKSEDGKEYSVDVLICATGFDTSFRPRFPIIGPGGINLQDIWSEEPRSYLGIAAPQLPNLLMFLGPHSPVGNGPTLAGIETQADHILMLLDRWQTENIHSFAPKITAVEDFTEHIHNFMKKTVWTQQCRSSYKNNTVASRVPSLWPGSTLHYIEALQELRADDWDIQYAGNRFCWLGNGISQAEFDSTCELGYYIKDCDDSPYASRGKRREVRTKSGTQQPRALHRVYRADHGS